MYKRPKLVGIKLQHMYWQVHSTRWLSCVECHNTVFVSKRPAVCAPAVYFLHRISIILLSPFMTTYNYRRAVNIASPECILSDEFHMHHSFCI